MTSIAPNGMADESLKGIKVLSEVEKELRQGLTMFWEQAGRILEGSGVGLNSPPPGYDSLEKNFFSALFLYSYRRGGIEEGRRVVYAAVNQCLRAMVTGCDNLLDDEYKMTLDTDLPESGFRFRSVLDIMAADRALFRILLEFGRKEGLDNHLIAKAGDVSLRALARSGAQEASEEGGIVVRPSPETVLSDVHHYKTGLLFQCVWAVPEVFETSLAEDVEPLKSALYDIGMGCQVLDDLMDVIDDARTRRHNYVASLIQHELGEKVFTGLHRHAARAPRRDEAVAFYSEYPEAFGPPYGVAMTYLREGLGCLFGGKFRSLVDPARAFIETRLGIDRAREASRNAKGEKAS